MNRALGYAVAAVPAVAFFATPFLPFADTTRLWFGLPAVLVWGVVWTLGTTAALAVTERLGTHRDEQEGTTA
ncbi:hypothetical protein [Streptomyces mexicanus]|uniref:hypothetical protein n=1 Tax=Streptomyces mexicanus TaxID=178566 RepID=UPI00367F8495